MCICTIAKIRNVYTDRQSTPSLLHYCSHTHYRSFMTNDWLTKLVVLSMSNKLFEIIHPSSFPFSHPYISIVMLSYLRLFLYYYRYVEILSRRRAHIHMDSTLHCLSLLQTIFLLTSVCCLRLFLHLIRVNARRSQSGCPCYPDSYPAVNLKVNRC